MFGRRRGSFVFFVNKKHNKLRLVLDARRANTRFSLPPRVELVSAEGLSRIVLDMPDGEGSVLVHCGTADVQDACHRMEISMLRDARSSSQ